VSRYGTQAGHDRHPSILNREGHARVGGGVQIVCDGYRRGDVELLSACCRLMDLLRRRRTSVLNGLIQREIFYGSYARGYRTPAHRHGRRSEPADRQAITWLKGNYASRASGGTRADGAHGCLDVPPPFPGDDRDEPCAVSELLRSIRARADVMDGLDASSAAFEVVAEETRPRLNWVTLS